MVRSVAFVCVVAAAGCGPDNGMQPGDHGRDAGVDTGQPDAGQPDAAAPIDYDQKLKPLLDAAGAAPISKPTDVNQARVRLGRMLFFDPILSGNRDTACATCHRPSQGTTVHRSLVVGTKAVMRDGLRMPGPDHSFTPRNPPGLFNLGDDNVTSLFWDGRVTRNAAGQLVLYDKGWQKSGDSYLRSLSPILDSMLAAQTMVPVINRDEMRGDYGESDIHGQTNELAQVPDQDLDLVWQRVIDRLKANPNYRQLFQEAYPDTPIDQIVLAHASNALGSFVTQAFTFDDSPFDRYLRGDKSALTQQQKRGAYLFYGEAGCARCHSGPALSDGKLYNVGVRPIGPGPGKPQYDVDYGAVLRTNAGEDKKYAFRTPMLRNVALTGPWMHNGAYTTLEAAVRHFINVKKSLETYDASQLDEEFRRYVHQREEVIQDVETTLEPMPVLDLSDAQVDALVAFLNSLSSPSAEHLGDVVPDQVPSGDPIPLP